MTNDYKKSLLDYITNIKEGTPTTNEIFKELNEIARSEWSNYIPEHWSSFRLDGAIRSNTSDRVIFYGSYALQNESAVTSSRGIIIITDNNLNPIKTIYKFSSGTDLRPLQCMYQEEDGQFVAVDSIVMYSSAQEVQQALMTCQKRFIMLNDISKPINDEYVVNLRISYVLGNTYTNFGCKQIFKNPTTSHYLMTGYRIVYKNNRYDPDGIRIIHLKINVGSANEWNLNDSGNDYLYGGVFAYFDSNDNVIWKTIITGTASNNSGIFVWGGTNTTAPPATLIHGTTTYRPYIDGQYYPNQVVFKNENTAYYVMNNQRWGVTGTPESKYIGLFQVDLTTNLVSNEFLHYIGNYDHVNLDTMYLQILNGELYVQYCTNVDEVNNTADYYVQRYKDEWNPILVKEAGSYVHYQRNFYVSQNFNLLKMYLYPINLRSQTWFMEQITEVYNIANYNGEEYEGYNSLKARYGNIYSNDKIVFSRNLNNLSVTNNYSLASIEVPNTFLNDINLNLKELVGETNSVLVEDGRTITKNMYEVLYLNYINSINVKNNNGDIVKELGIYVNNNINIGTKANHNNTKCNKVLINYTDTTNRNFGIGWTSIDDTHKYTEFTIYVDKQIESIELLSNDLSTTYITIQQELEVGKYYTFKQYLKVE